MGDAPRREDLRHDKPFVAGDGKLLWGLLAKKANISRADCYILNVIGEWGEGKNASPTPKQIEKWWDEFNANISEFTGSIVVLLGTEAFRRVTGKAGKNNGITDWRGYLMSREDVEAVQRKKAIQTFYKSTGKGHKKGDPRTTTQKVWEACPLPESVGTIIPTLHPWTVIRTGYAQSPALSADIGRVGRALRGELRPYREGFSESAPVDILVSPPRGPVSLDIETRMGGLDADSIERIGVASAEGTWTAVWDNTARLCTRAAMSGEGPFIFHNVGFDAPRLAREGCPVPEPWWDTMYAALLLQPDLLKGLNGVSSLYLDRRRWKHLSADLPAFYNAQDVSAQFELYHALRGALQSTGQLDLFENTIMRALPVFVEMTELGVPVDIEEQNRWTEQLERTRAQKMAEWSILAPGVSPFSPPQLKGFLYGALGMPEQLSKYGGTTTDESSLRGLLGLKQCQPHRRLLELLLEIRDVNKQLETYAKVLVSEDGRIHPQWMPAAKDSEGFGKGIAGTGRPTSRGPNFQNISPDAKRLYTGSPGCCLIEADWSQIEARIVAALAGDKVLTEAIRVGLHRANMEALGVGKVVAKIFFYGWCYGMGKRTMRKHMLSKGYDFSEAECDALLKALEATYAATTSWRRDVANLAASTYRLHNSFGRRRNFLRGSGDTPAALDFLPQSNAADCMWSIVRPVSDALKGIGARILGTIHDSVLIECPVGSADEGARLLREGMEREFPQIAPGFYVPVEVKIGKNWGEMRPYEAPSRLAA